MSRPELLLHRDARVDVFFAPLDVVNSSARLLLVGLTPGRAQALLALQTTRSRLGAGASLADALAAAKATASFAGPMRANLVAMLDAVGVHAALGVGTCADLFTDRTDLVSTTSALCHPVFLRSGRNYGGSTPRIDRHELLAAFARRVLGAHLALVPDALVVPLGRAVAAVLPATGVDPRRVLAGLPHPSGNNGHRVRQFAEHRDGLRRAVDTWASGGPATSRGPAGGASRPGRSGTRRS